MARGDSMGPHACRACLRSDQALAVHILDFPAAIARNSQGLPPTCIPTLAHLPVLLFKLASTLSASLASGSYHYPPPTRAFSRRPRLRIRTPHPGRGPILAWDLPHASQQPSTPSSPPPQRQRQRQQLQQQDLIIIALFRLLTLLTVLLRNGCNGGGSSTTSAHTLHPLIRSPSRRGTARRCRSAETLGWVGRCGVSADAYGGGC